MVFTEKELAAEQWRRFRDTAIEVSDLGRVRYPARGRTFLRFPRRTAAGYAVIDMRDRGTRRSHLVHRMVLEAFVGPPPPDKPHGCHYDGNGLNNRLSNLRWDTALANTEDARRHGTSTSKLTGAAVRQIAKRLRLGESTRSIARRYGVSQVAITHINTGRTWGHITGQDPSVPALSAAGNTGHPGKRTRIYTWTDPRTGRRTYGRACLPDKAPPETADTPRSTDDPVQQLIDRMRAKRRAADLVES